MNDPKNKLISAIDVEVLRVTNRTLTPSARTTIAKRIVYTIAAIQALQEEIARVQKEVERLKSANEAWHRRVSLGLPDGPTT